MGYIVFCGGALLYQVGCHSLETGEVLKGFVHGDKLSVSVGDKTRTYRIETSAYIGPLTTKAGSASESAKNQSTAPSVKLAVEKSSAESAGVAPAGQTSQADSHTAKVTFSSEPSGADIYVDDKFMGNTPSEVQLSAGPHTIRIEAKGQKPWSRTITLTAGGKVTIQAALNPELP